MQGTRLFKDMPQLSAASLDVLDKLDFRTASPVQEACIPLFTGQYYFKITSQCRLKSEANLDCSPSACWRFQDMLSILSLDKEPSLYTALNLVNIQYIGNCGAPTAMPICQIL